MLLTPKTHPVCAGLISIAGYIICALIHGEIVSMAFTFVQYLIMLPFYVNMLQIFRYPPHCCSQLTVLLTRRGVVMVGLATQLVQLERCQLGHRSNR